MLFLYSEEKRLIVSIWGCLKSLNNLIKFLPYTKSIELYNDSEKNDCLAILKKIISNS